jgi:hypothetical protein
MTTPTEFAHLPAENHCTGACSVEGMTLELSTSVAPAGEVDRPVTRAVSATAAIRCGNGATLSNLHQNDILMCATTGNQEATRQFIHRSRYSPGEGALAGRGNKGTICIHALGYTRLALNRRAPECVEGGCVGARAEARLEFNYVGFNIVSEQLSAILAARATEELLADWYDHGQQSPPPETLRRRLSMTHDGWCSAPIGSGWEFGLQVIGVNAGASGESGGYVMQQRHRTRLRRNVEVCLLPPSSAPTQAVEFAILIEGRVEASSWLDGGSHSEGNAAVEVKLLELTTQTGCVECVPIDDGTGLGHTDGSVGAG